MTNAHDVFIVSDIIDINMPCTHPCNSIKMGRTHQQGYR